MNLINNFIDNNELYEINKLINLKDFPWFISKEDPYLQFHHEVHNSLIGPTILKSFIEKIKIKKIHKGILKRICHTNKLQNCDNTILYNYNKPTKNAVFFFNTNDGLTKYGLDQSVKSIENSLLLFNSNQPFYQTTCTDKTSRLILEINYE